MEKIQKVIEGTKKFQSDMKAFSTKMEDASNEVKKRVESFDKCVKRVRKYTDEQVIKTAAAVHSMAQLLKSVNLRVAGGNYANMKRTLQRLNVNCDHWKGQAWSKSEQLKDWSEYTQISCLKRHLIKKRGHQCERCKRKNWQGQPITLELDHLNGDRTDNREENLKLNCPNCHALTPTWRGRKNGKHNNHGRIQEKNSELPAKFTIY